MVAMAIDKNHAEKRETAKDVQRLEPLPLRHAGRGRGDLDSPLLSQVYCRLLILDHWAGLAGRRCLCVGERPL